MLEFRTFQAVCAAGVVIAAAAILVLFPFLYIPVVPGLALLWGEIAVGFAANRVALMLTKRGVALTGLRGEQNPAMRTMLASGNFTKLYLVYATMVGGGLVITILSIRLGAVLFGTVLLVVAFPLFLMLDMLNDYIVVSRLERERSGRGP